MSELLKGAPVAAALAEQSAADCAALKEKGIVPCLAIVRLGANDSDLSYERGAMKRCAAAGVEVRNVVLDADISEQALLDELEDLNKNDAVHGILLFRPLPKHINDERIRAVLAPEKDVDGVTDGSLAGVFCGTKKGFAPCTAQAVIETLKYYKIPMSGKRAVVMGRSLVVGRPAAALLMQENATVTVTHTKTVDDAGTARSADILVVAIGRARAVNAAYLAPQQVVIDVGIHADDETGKLCGDVDFAAADGLVSAITPVPGGLGAVTTAVLVRHVVDAAMRSLN